MTEGPPSCGSCEGPADCICDGGKDHSAICDRAVKARPSKKAMAAVAEAAFMEHLKTHNCVACETVARMAGVWK